MTEQIKLADFIGPPSEAADHLMLQEVQPDFENLARKTSKRKLTTTMTLTSDTCKWPFGDPATSDFYYCGELPQSGRPYCEEHNSMSYQSARRKSS
jgi:GcrA cell cycle regulator